MSRRRHSGSASIRKAKSDSPASADRIVIVRSLAVSCAAAEDLLRKMLEEWDFSLEVLLSAHMVNCSDARRALGTLDAKRPGVRLLVRAFEELEKALQTLNSYRYSTDPEYRHRKMFQSKALELVDRAKQFRATAIELLP